MPRYRVKNTVPVDNILKRVERLEVLMDVLNLEIPESLYNELSDKNKDLFEVAPPEEPLDFTTPKV